MIDYKPSRLFVSASQRSFNPTITNTPDLPAIDWSQVGQVPPKLLGSTSADLPRADAIVITWAGAEWAAMQHVFCASETAMHYSDPNTNSWNGWTKFADGRPPGAPSGWDFWGEWRLVEIAGNTVMLFKSNTHLDWPDQVYLSDLIKLLISNVRPALVLSIGTAGGAEVGDHIGTIRAVSAGTLYIQGAPSSSWPTYENAWTAPETLINQAGFNKLLLPIPTTSSDLMSLCAQFNNDYSSTYTLAELNPGDLNNGDTFPRVIDQTDGDTSVLTTSTFVVGSTSGGTAATPALKWMMPLSAIFVIQTGSYLASYATFPIPFRMPRCPQIYRATGEVPFTTAMVSTPASMEHSRHGQFWRRSNIELQAMKLI